MLRENIFLAFCRFAFICAILLFQSQNLYALNARKSATQYVHDARTTNGGLPQDSVNVIVQTGDGHLWFAAQEGLVRFDGVGFRVSIRAIPG